MTSTSMSRFVPWQFAPNVCILGCLQIACSSVSEIYADAQVVEVGWQYHLDEKLKIIKSSSSEILSLVSDRSSLRGLDERFTVA